MKMTDKDFTEMLYRVLQGDVAGAREYALRAGSGMKHPKRHPAAPYCTACTHKAENRNLFEKQTVVGIIDGKKRKRRMKPGEMWCLNGTMFRINQNHRRWWGFDRRCPLNPHSHFCEACGTRMCTYDSMCKICARNRQYL
jgi:hypothetical protein